MTEIELPYFKQTRNFNVYHIDNKDVCIATVYLPIKISEKKDSIKIVC